MQLAMRRVLTTTVLQLAIPTVLLIFADVGELAPVEGEGVKRGGVNSRCEQRGVKRTCDGLLAAHHVTPVLVSWSAQM